MSGTDKDKGRSGEDTAPPLTRGGADRSRRGARRCASAAMRSVAARGGFPGDIAGNTVVKEALEADGTVADGYTPDGTTRTGKKPADSVVTTEAEPGGEKPAEHGTTRVQVKEPECPTLPARPCAEGRYGADRAAAADRHHEGALIHGVHHHRAAQPRR